MHTEDQIQRAAKLAEEFDPSGVPMDDTTDLRTLAEAVDAVRGGEARVRELVARARGNGRSWGEIGIALGVVLLRGGSSAIEVIAGLLCFALACEVYIFVYTMISSSVTVSLLLKLRKGRANWAALDAEYSDAAMVGPTSLTLPWLSMLGAGNWPAASWLASSARMLLSSIVGPLLAAEGVMVVWPPKPPRPMTWLVPPAVLYSVSQSK